MGFKLRTFSNPFDVVPKLAADVRRATGTIMHGKQPIAATPEVLEVIEPEYPQELALAQVRMHVAAKIGEAGVYSTLEILVETIGYYPDGDMKERTRVASRDFAWISAFLDSKAGELNAMKQAIGHTGVWFPSGVRTGEAPTVGARCPTCGEPQFETSMGTYCRYGHGR